MSVPKSAAQTFTEGWDKAIAWAQSEGISADSYMPVYQSDLTRLQTGGYPMSASERNREILAAHTPTTVTPTPSPSPTNVLHNVLNTARNLFTGLIHLPEEIYHSADATFHAIENPASLNAKSPGATVGNWLNDTLLAFLPGAADIGTLLQKGGTEGLATLAEHPLAAFLDVLPGSEGLGGILGKFHGAGEIDAAAADAGRSLIARVAHGVGSIPTRKAGVTLAGEATSSLTLGQRIANLAARLGPGGSGVGPALSDLGGFVQNSSVLGQNMFSWLFDGPGRAYSALDDPEKLQVRHLLETRQADGGQRLLAALDSPDLSAGVRDTLTQFLEGPLRFATEEDIFSGDLHAVDTPSGKTGYYVGPRMEVIDAARKARALAEHQATKAVLGMEGHGEKLSELEAMLPKALSTFQGRLQAARTAVAQDAGLLENVTQEIPGANRLAPKRRGIAKSAQVKAVVGEGGLADDLVRQIRRSKDPAQIKALADAMKRRLSKWGPKSVDAADNPALASLAETVDAFSKWADAYRKETEAIDKAIHGEAGLQRQALAETDAYAVARREVLKQRQAAERDNLREGYQRSRSQARGNFARRLTHLNDTRTDLDAAIMRDAEAAAARATKAGVDEAWRAAKARLLQLKQDFVTSVTHERKEYLGRDKEAKLSYQRDQSRMARRHLAETEALKAERRGTRAAQGEVVKELDGWAKAVDGFRQAVADNPADKFRDAMMVLFEKHLLAHLHTADLVDETKRFVEKETPGKWEELTHDSGALAEYLVFRFRDIYGEPRLAPEAVADAEDAYREAWESADTELKRLIAQGFDVPYIPSSVTSDVMLGRNAIKPLIGRGIPTTDLAKAKVWDVTPQTGDFALGISKAVVQALQRDATIDLVEHYLRPMSMTGEEVKAFVAQTRGPGALGEIGNISQRYLTVARDELGLESIRPKELFGFSLPRWGEQEIWLPKGIVSALKQIQHERKRGIFAKATKVFRYSILGLSPRFDAHILFGGTVMGAFRVSPHAFRMIGDAYRAVRDGTIPEIPGHSTIEEGFDDTVVRMFHEQAGQQMLKLEIAENVERRQGIARAAVKPVHIAKAIADVNFRFTRYVRSLQVAVVYLDAAAKAVRRDAKLALPAADTGRTVYLSAERAMEQGMRAVEDVYGNLGRMSPLERQISQSLMPFYSWQKHIMKYVLTFPVDHPWRALVLSQAATRASESVPSSWPIRSQLLFFLGSPTKTGTVTALDIRSVDPFRTTANYFTLSGWLESLNPLITAPVAMVDPEFVYGSNVLYPNLTYTAFYGQEVAGAQGNLVTGLSQVAPQLSAATSALSAISGVRSLWKSDRPAAIKQLLNNLNIPFVTPPINLKQLAAHGEQARYETARAAATTAFRTGTFKGIAHYKTVPNPLGPEYTISPAALEALYKFAKAQNPNVAPIESLLPPPVPFGY